MSKARVKPNSSFLKKKNQKSELLIGEIKVKSCVGMKMRKSATSAKSGTFSPQFKNKPEAALPAPEVVQTTTTSPAPDPAPAPSQSSGNILFDISSFSGNFSPETGFRQGQDKDDPNETFYYTSLPPKAINALTRAANRWAYFLSFTPEYVKVMSTLVPSWKGITLDRFQISTTNFDTGRVWGTTTIASSAPIVKVSDTSFIIGGKMGVNIADFNRYNENQWFHILSHELGHILGFGTVTVKDQFGEVLPRKYVDPAPHHNLYQFYDEDHFPLAVDAYIKKYKGKTKDRGDTTAQCNIDISPLGLIPLDSTYDKGINNYKHWSSTALTYEESPDPNLYKPDLCTGEHVWYLYGDARPMVIFRGLYNEIMVPDWDAKIDSESGYLITEITLGALAALYTIWDKVKIHTYTLLRGSRTIGASEDTTFNKYEKGDDFLIHFLGNVINKEIKIEDEDEEDKSLSKETIIHKCSVCEPIYLDACGNCS